MESDILFNVQTPLGFSVRTTRRYWNLNLVKHEAMIGRERDVIDTLQNPDEVRVSQSDSEVLLYYRAHPPGRWICVLARRLNGDEGFMITAYPTDALKEGIWHGAGKPDKRIC